MTVKKWDDCMKGKPKVTIVSPLFHYFVSLYVEEPGPFDR